MIVEEGTALFHVTGIAGFIGVVSHQLLWIVTMEIVTG